MSDNVNIPTTPPGWPMSVTDIERLNKFVDAHQKILHFYSSGSLVDKVLSVVHNYKNATVNTLNAHKDLRDDIVTHFRAMAMILEMVGNAGTHREKEARLRGCIEMLETGIKKLQDVTFDASTAWNRHTDVFRSDYPIRAQMDRIRELEYALEKATGKSVRGKRLYELVEEADCPF